MFVERPLTLAARLRSFVYAGRGVAALLRTQHNAWIHALATAAAVLAGLWLGVSRLEWVALILAIAAVWAAEAFNTAIESLADVISPAHHPLIERSKDVAAGGVLICAAAAALVGLLVLGPHLLQALR